MHMKKLYLPGRTREVCVALAALMFCVAACFEIKYQEGLRRLPSLVNEKGETASLAAAIAGLDMYERVKRERIIAAVFLGVGVVLGVFTTVTTTRKEKPHDP